MPDVSEEDHLIMLSDHPDRVIMKVGGTWCSSLPVSYRRRIRTDEPRDCCHGTDRDRPRLLGPRAIAARDAEYDGAAIPRMYLIPSRLPPCRTSVAGSGVAV